MFKKLLCTLPLMLGVSINAHAEINDITFTSEPAVLDMPCSAEQLDFSEFSPTQTQVLVYTVKNNTSSDIKIKSDIKVLAEDTSYATSRITGGTCNAKVGESFSLSAKNSCTIAITMVSDQCSNEHKKEELILVDRKLELTPHTMGNVISSHISFVVRSSNSQFAYIADPYTQKVTVCELAPNGYFNACTDSGVKFDSPVDVILNNDATLAYVANYANFKSENSATADFISVCTVSHVHDMTFGLFTECTNTDETFSFDLESAGLRLNADNSKLYVTNYENNSVDICTILADGSLKHPCTSYNIVTDDEYQDTPYGRVTFNFGNEPGYVANNNNSDITICNFKEDDDCYDFFDSNSTIVYPLGLDTDLSGTWLYVVSEFEYYDPLNNIYHYYVMSNCKINPQTGDLEDCDFSTGNQLPFDEYCYNSGGEKNGYCPSYFGFGYSDVVNPFMRNTNGYAYIPTTTDPDGQYYGNIAICKINLTNGLLYSETCYNDEAYLYYNDYGYNSFNPVSVWISTLPTQLFE